MSASSAEYEFSSRRHHGRWALSDDGSDYGWLTVCDPAHQSITEMAHALGVSKASISTVVRQLQQAQMVERVLVPGSRQHHYRVSAGGWAQVLRARGTRLHPGALAADFGLAHIGPDRVEQRERLHEMRDFFDFVETELGEVLARRWETYRTRARDERHIATLTAAPGHGRPDRRPGRMPSARCGRKTDSDRRLTVPIDLPC
jgi:DNA-binding MarR family transcriptional regulator